MCDSESSKAMGLQDVQNIELVLLSACQNFSGSATAIPNKLASEMSNKHNENVMNNNVFVHQAQPNLHHDASGTSFGYAESCRTDGGYGGRQERQILRNHSPSRIPLSVGRRQGSFSYDHEDERTSSQLDTEVCVRAKKIHQSKIPVAAAAMTQNYGCKKTSDLELPPRPKSARANRPPPPIPVRRKIPPEDQAKTYTQMETVESRNRVKEAFLSCSNSLLTMSNSKTAVRSAKSSTGSDKSKHSPTLSMPSKTTAKLDHSLHHGLLVKANPSMSRQELKTSLHNLAAELRRRSDYDFCVDLEMVEGEEIQNVSEKELEHAELKYACHSSEDLQQQQVNVRRGDCCGQHNTSSSSPCTENDTSFSSVTKVFCVGAILVGIFTVMNSLPPQVFKNLPN